MQCPKCQYEMQPFETECPKCARLAVQGKSTPATPGQRPATAAPTQQSRQWSCPKCHTANPTSTASCSRCGTPYIPRDDEDTASNSGVAVRVVFFLIILALYAAFNPDIRPYFSSPNIIYRGTVSTANGEILLIGASIRSLGNAEAATKKIVAAENAGKKYIGVEVGYYTPFHVPSRRLSVRTWTVEQDLKGGTADRIYSCATDGSIKQRPQGEPLKVTPPEDSIKGLLE